MNLRILLITLFFTKIALALTLDEAIEEAIRNNFLIKKRIELIKAAEKEKYEAIADFLPKISYSYTYQRFKERPYAIFENPLIPEKKYRVHIGGIDQFSWDITLSQPLFTGFYLISKYKIAKLGVELNRLYRDQAILDIVQDVKVSYFQVLLSKRYLKIAQEEVIQLSSHLKDAENFYRQGIIPYNDLLKSKVALFQAKQNLVKARANLKIAISRLNTVLERDIDEKVELKDIDSLEKVRYELKSLYSIALQKRPEIKALKIAIKQARQKIRAAKSGFYPHIYLYARYEQIGEDPFAKENDYGRSYNAFIGFQAKWTLFEWGKTKAAVEKQIHRYRALLNELEKLKDRIKLEVKSIYEELKVAEKNIETARIALSQAKENFRITDLQYKQNLTTSTEVLDARTYLTQAEVNYYSALYGYMILKAKLERAIGVMRL